MSSNLEKEEWSAEEEEFREEENMQEEYDQEEDVPLDEEEYVDDGEYDENAQYSGEENQEEYYEEDELKHNDDYADEDVQYDDEEDLGLTDTSEEVTKGEEYVDEYYMKKQRDLSRQLEEDRQTSRFQQKIFSFVLCLSIATTIWLTFWIPNQISIDSSDFSVYGITPSITDDGKSDYEVSFKGLGELTFTNNNPKFVSMVLTGFILHARFLCDTPASSPFCESLENGTTTSHFYPMSTWHRGSVIYDDEGKKHYSLRIPKAIASSTEIRDIMHAACEQNQKFRVEFRGEAEIIHEFSSGFSMPVTNIPSHTFDCVEPNQKTGGIFS